MIIRLLSIFIGVALSASSTCNTNQLNSRKPTDIEGYCRAYDKSFTYKREHWNHWSDLDGDCMNTRHEILLEQADGPVTLSPNGCYVSKGTWIDPFSGKMFFRASELDVDHVIPLMWAHLHGGWAWSAEEKEVFANDELNLLAVHDELNKKKGAKGPTEWMPPNVQFRCEYIDIWSRVLNKYPSLCLYPKEKRIFDRMLTACGKA